MLWSSKMGAEFLTMFHADPKENWPIEEAVHIQFTEES